MAMCILSTARYADGKPRKHGVNRKHDRDVGGCSVGTRAMPGFHPNKLKASE
jgi:hypothetical protein